jgi:hypothetical protein
LLETRGAKSSEKVAGTTESDFKVQQEDVEDVLVAVADPMPVAGRRESVHSESGLENGRDERVDDVR